MFVEPPEIEEVKQKKKSNNKKTPNQPNKQKTQECFRRLFSYPVEKDEKECSSEDNCSTRKMTEAKEWGSLYRSKMGGGQR